MMPIWYHNYFFRHVWKEKVTAMMFKNLNFLCKNNDFKHYLVAQLQSQKRTTKKKLPHLKILDLYAYLTLFVLCTTGFVIISTKEPRGNLNLARGRVWQKFNLWGASHTHVFISPFEKEDHLSFFSIDLLLLHW